MSNIPFSINQIECQFLKRKEKNTHTHIYKAELTATAVVIICHRVYYSNDCNNNHVSRSAIFEMNRFRIQNIQFIMAAHTERERDSLRCAILDIEKKTRIFE